MKDFTFRAHPEKNIDCFTAFDGTVKFFGFVKAIILKTDARDVLDFGAGRGGFWYDDPSVYRKQMYDLRAGGNTTVTACDVDPVVLTHPCSHAQVVIKPDEPLPFADETFDVIVSDRTFEHIENPELVSRELLRTLRPGGYICARTPNRFGYVQLASRLFPNRLHSWLLGYVQPDRKAEDVFSTRYKMNSLAQIKRWFSGCDVYHYHDSALPAYYFGRKAFYDIFFLIHKLAPAFLATGVCFFIKKPPR